MGLERGCERADKRNTRPQRAVIFRPVTSASTSVWAGPRKLIWKCGGPLGRIRYCMMFALISFFPCGSRRNDDLDLWDVAGSGWTGGVAGSGAAYTGRHGGERTGP